MRDEDFERLYADEAPGLFSFLAYRTGDRALAQDLLGDAFERALRSRRRHEPRRGSAKTWLYAIALRFGAEMTAPEIAATLGEKLTTVEGRVYRALRKLRVELEGARQEQPRA